MEVDLKHTCLKGKLRHFPAKLALVTGMKVSPLIKIFISVKFENFWKWLNFQASRGG